jgi:hypothetical protein
MKKKHAHTDTTIPHVRLRRWTSWRRC